MTSPEPSPGSVGTATGSAGRWAEGSTTGSAGRPDQLAGLLDLLAATVLDTPAVVGLEPTLSNALQRLGARSLPAAALGGRIGSRADRVVQRTAADGISVRRIAGATDVRVDLIVSTERPARLTAEDVERRVRTVLVEHGHEAGSVVVTVLASRDHPRAEHV